MIKGITITLINRIASGTDPFNRPTYTEDVKTVENVLIGQPDTEAINGDLQMYGKRLAYTLAIPKGDTHEWEDAFVEFDPTGTGQPVKRFHVYRSVTAGIEANIPLSWNKKVYVEAFNEQMQV